MHNSPTKENALTFCASAFSKYSFFSSFLIQFYNLTIYIKKISSLFMVKNDIFLKIFS